jgi:hypothetical protein
VTVDELEAFWEAHSNEYLRFERIENPLSRCRDLHAFLLLNKLVPGSRDIICAAEHDAVWLETKVRELLKIATESELIDLHRCGVMYDSENELLQMWV